MNITLGTKSLDFAHWEPACGRVFSDTYAFDAETAALDKTCPWITPCFVLGAACDGRRGFWVPRKYLAEFLAAHAGLPVVFHNAAFDLAVLQLAIRNRVDLYAWVDAGLVWDTWLLHRLLVLSEEGRTARRAGEATLETCVRTYLGQELPKDLKDSDGREVRTSYVRLLEKAPGEIEPIYLEYPAKDAWSTLLVYRELRSRVDERLANSAGAVGYIDADWLESQVHQWGPLTHHIQLRAALVLREITANGLHVGLDQVERLKPALEASRDRLLEELRGHGYLPGKGSDKALQAILTRIERQRPELALPRTPGDGRISTSKESLEQLQGLEPFVDTLLEYKETEKLLTTYLEKMQTGVLHPSFEPLVESGRTSSYGEINAQNLPRSQEVRSCLVPKPGHVLLDVDYATLELVTLAQTVQRVTGRSPKMGEYINADHDLHEVVAAAVLGKTVDKVDKDERQKVKAFNFGKPGGMGTAGLIRYAKKSYKISLSEEEAQDIEAAWFDLFPEMRGYLAKRVDEAVELTRLLGLTQDGLSAAQGRHWSHKEDDIESAGWLGGMCLKVTRCEQPLSKAGKAYAPEAVDYFWTKLEEGLELFPEELHADILARKPSLELTIKLRNWLTAAPVFTTTGRLRANAGHCQQKNTPFQGLAADGAKLALWKLWRAGYRIVNFIHDEVVVEVPEDCDLAAELQKVKQLMIEGMEEVVSDITVRVEGYASRCWSKDGKIELEPTVSDPESPTLRAAA